MGLPPIHYYYYSFCIVSAPEGAPEAPKAPKNQKNGWVNMNNNRESGWKDHHGARKRQSGMIGFTSVIGDGPLNY